MTETHTILLKKVTIIDSGSTHHLKTRDVLIEDGHVKTIAEKIDTKADYCVEEEDLHLSPGWFDLRVNFRDPGNGDAEDFNSGAAAAIAGGFTAVGLAPNTEPIIDRKADIENVYHAAEELPLHVYPFAAFTQGLAGKELSEMFDLFEAGAVGFSHGITALENTALLKLALQYGREFAPPLHLLTFDENLRQNGVMHEGNKSTWLGLKGIPAVAEELGILQALHLAQYAQTGVHLQGISARSTVALLQEAKAKNKLFTADVNLANLVFTDEDLSDYNTNLKVYPPLREKEDQDALIDALRDGIITVITSNHEPHAIEAKRCEFDLAEFGAAGLETFFGALWQRLSGEIELSQVIDCIARNPRSLLGLDVPSVTEGSYAEFTLFKPNASYTVESSALESKGSNNPYLNKNLKGKVVGTIVKGTLVLH
jgi:dihydroorotase